MHDLTARLLAWYDQHRRVLPWREQPTPYHVLLSELMLQQTRVETVIPYFERFTARWPTLQDLAHADEDEVMHAWAGLGYYRRARSLLNAARAAVARGGLPSDPAALLDLPGIGPYTAGAIASIAFQVATPTVDGNIERVLCRLYGLDADPRSAAGRKAVWAHAEALVPEGRPGDHNQALMELGATVCSPRSPRCMACPWFNDCVARQQGTQASLPNKVPKAKPMPVRGVAGLLAVDGSWLLVRRPPGGLLGGLWDVPSAEIEPDADATEAVLALFRDALGLEVRIVSGLGEVRHVFTHRRLTRQVFHVVPIGVQAPSMGGDFDAVQPLADGLALSKLAHKTLSLAPAS